MTYTDEQIERAAKAIYDLDPWHVTYDFGDWLATPFDDLDEVDKEDFRKQARAALEAVSGSTVQP